MNKLPLFDKAETIETLKDWGIKDGSDIYVIVTSVSASGMSRRMKFFVPAKDDRGNLAIYDITRHVGTVTDIKANDDWTLTVSGCGMDMCYHMVEWLGKKLGLSLNKRQL